MKNTKLCVRIFHKYLLLKCALAQKSCWAPLLGLSLLYATSMPGQSWAWAKSAGGPYTETCESTALLSDGSVVMGGVFNEVTHIGNRHLQSKGGFDWWVARFDNQGAPLWVIDAGSTSDDSIIDMAVDTLDNIYLIGVFWNEIVIGQDTLATERNPKVFSLSKVSPAGEILWTKKVEGTGKKELIKLAVGNQDQGIFVTGGFEDSLIFDKRQWGALSKQDLLILHLDGEGEFLNFRQYGAVGENMGVGLELDAYGNLWLGGNFNGSLEMAGQRVNANTSDLDIFIARFDKNLEPQWIIKGGGVLDQELSALMYTEDNAIIATGNFTGVLRLGNGPAVESPDGFSEGFVLKVDAEGKARWAKNFGGRGPQVITGADLCCGNIAVGGYFQNQLRWNEEEISAVEQLGSFVGIMDTAGNFNALYNFSSGEEAYLCRPLWIDGQNLMLAGSFSSAFPVFGAGLYSSGEFDVFLGKWSTGLPVKAPISGGNNKPFKVFPNPCNGIFTLHLPGYVNGNYRLFNRLGKVVLKGKISPQMDFSIFQPGLYFLEIELGRRVYTEKIMIFDR